MEGFQVQAMVISGTHFGGNPIFDKGERIKPLTKQVTQFSFP